VLRFCYSDIVKGVSKIILQSKSHEEQGAASNLLKQIEKFEFIFLTEPLSVIFQIGAVMLFALKLNLHLFRLKSSDDSGEEETGNKDLQKAEKESLVSILFVMNVFSKCSCV
jgi:hypothetical protein